MGLQLKKSSWKVSFSACSKLFYTLLLNIQVLKSMLSFKHNSISWAVIKKYQGWIFNFSNLKFKVLIYRRLPRSLSSNSQNFRSVVSCTTQDCESAASLLIRPNYVQFMNFQFRIQKKLHRAVESGENGWYCTCTTLCLIKTANQKVLRLCP